MQMIINEILRKHHVIDNGVSKAIFETLDPMIQNTIRKEISLAEMASSAMSGMMANPEYQDMSNTMMANCSIGMAMKMLNALEELRDSDNAH